MNQVIPQGYKNTKVGVIPKDWEEYLFSDIFIFSTGKNIKQNEASPEFTIPCVRYGELYHMYNEIITKVINKTNLDKSELLFSKGNEILLPSAGEDPLDIGSASALTLENIAIGRTINILRPAKENIYSQEYMAYYINHQLKRNIASLAKGSSISNVYNSDLKKLKIPLPPLKEQQKIANILTTWDDAISKQDELIKVKEELKKGLMQKLLSGEVRFDGFFGEWEEVRLKEISFKKSSNISANTLENNNGKYKIYGASGLLKYIDFFRENEEYISIVKDGAGVGRVLICEKNSSVLGTLDIIKSNENINLYFIYLLLKRLKFEKYIIGSTIPHIYYKDYSTAKINIPPLQEQQKIADVLSNADKEIDLLKNELQELIEQKKGLMQKLLTGVVRVEV